MSMKQIRDHYGVPAKRGKKVLFGDLGLHGWIVSASGDHRIRIWYVRGNIGYKRYFHPLDNIDYLDGKGRRSL